MGLNPAQLQAVSHREGPCMVLAGPGSGKTTVITSRTAELVKQKVPADQILVVTFTRAAAEEMKERFVRLNGGENAVTFGTFHSVFFAMLRAGRRMSGDSLLTEPEKIRLLEGVFRKLKLDTENGRDVMVSLLSEISSVKNNLKDPKTFRSSVPGIVFSEVYACYEKEARSAEKIDYDDMMLMTLRMLRERPEVLKHWQERFRYIMIDEFQDINPLQYEIMRMLALPKNNLFIVGDDDQSIYRFRGARPEIMLNFEKDYPGCRKVLLDVNYRSEKRIVAAAADVIRHNKARFEKKLRTGKSGEGTVEIRRFPNETEETREIARQILIRKEEKVPLHEMAVLYRTNGCANRIAEALMEAKIPFYSKDRMQNLFRHFICGPVFAYLNYLQGNRTRANFLRFMNCPNRYIRRDDLKKETVDLNCLAALYQDSPERPWMTDKIRFLIYQFEFLKKMRVPFAMVNYIRKAMEYDEYVKDYADEKKMNADELLAVLDELQASAAPFETIDEWYRHIAAYSKELDRQETVKAADKKNRVLLSTLHGSKGLEFDTVFISDVNEKILPHEKSKEQDEIEEERRMFYVGITRAAQKLYIFSADEHFGKRTVPSRFLQEIGRNHGMNLF